MTSRQLLISPRYDGNAAAAAWGLRESGCDPLWPASGSLADEAIGGIGIHSDGVRGWRSGGALGAHQYSSVLYRWPREPQDRPNAHPSDAEFLRREWRSLQDNVYALHASLLPALWINPPDAANRTENKLVQLHHAARCGVRFPETLVSNDPRRIADFVAAPVPTIYKPFRSHSWGNSANGSIYHTPAALVDSSDLDPTALALCPGIFQRYVNKRSDLRVTMIGDRFFAARIRSRSKGAFTDWRPAQDDESDFLVEPCELPTAYQTRLKSMMDELGIVYGAIDLAEEQDGELVFLEVNQVGQFQFIERWVPELPLLQAYTAMLAEGRADYALDRYAGISLQRYLDSAEHRQWQAQLAAQPAPIALTGSIEDVAA